MTVQPNYHWQFNEREGNIAKDAIGGVEDRFHRSISWDGHGRIQKLRITRNTGVKRCLSYCLSLASVLAISAEAMAQPLPGRIAIPVSADENAQTQTDQAQTAQSPTPEATPTATDAAALRLQPFFNVNYNEGAGFTGFSSFGGFLPVFQTPGQNVTFIDGRVSVDNTGDFGGGLQAGYRALLNDSTIWGAYAGLDARSTGERTFTQAGVGTELLGENWDVTLNANLPLGNARQVIATDSQAINPQFVGNQLLVDEQRVDQIQAALTTVSLDGGLELFDFGEGSSLWGRGGVYYLSGEASQDSLGIRASVDYRIQNNLRVGLGVQNDGVFGTNAIFSVSALLGAPAQRPSNTEENSQARLWARAGEPIARTNTVLVENRTDVEIVQTDVTAINPETGNAFVFRHVDPSANGVENALLAEELIREGTFEDPLSTIAQAANVADANADNIIFVQEGNAGGGFTLPDGVQVRSVGPIQELNTQLGEVILPGSGSGNLPTVTGQVTIGNNTLVSGLEIDPTKFENGVEAASAAQELVNGIEARGQNITLEDNVIANVDTGINLPDIDGTVAIVRNQISNTTGDGIFFDDINGTDNVTVTVANNTLNTIGAEGIEFGLIEGDATANITVANNQITDAQLDSIFFDDIEANAVATITVSENVIDAENVDPLIAGGDGIEIDNIENNANATITVANNQISNVAFEGIEFGDIENDAIATVTVENNQIISNETGIEFDSIENRANATITVTGNTITVANEEGILFDDIENDTVSNITIAENSILSTATEGIEFDVIEDNANATINILNNQISNVGEEGVFFNDIQENATAAITVTGNSITNTGDDGIEFTLIEDNANVTATVTDNTIADVGADGIVFNIIEDADVTATVTNNTITTPGGDAVRIDHANSLQAEEILSVVEGSNITTDTVGDEIEDIEDALEVEDTLDVVVDTPSVIEEVADANVTVTVSDNTITNPGNDGVSIGHTASNDMCLALDNNSVTTPGGDGFELVSNGAGQFQVIDQANVTARNVGTFNPADIETNADFVEGTAGVPPCP